MARTRQKTSGKKRKAPARNADAFFEPDDERLGFLEDKDADKAASESEEEPEQEETAEEKRLRLGKRPCCLKQPAEL